MELSEFELGYLAGFIDGEGALLINKREHIGHNGKRYVGYSAYLDIGNTNKTCLLWIHNKLRVTSKIYENPQTGNRKIAYRIRISYKQAKPLLEKIVGKLIVKKQICQVFLQYDTTTNKEILWAKAKELNKRGIF